MSTEVRKRWFGWLAALALCPALGFGQVILVDPENATVCVGEVATFTSKTNGALTGWRVNSINIEGLPIELDTDVGLINGTNTLVLKFTEYNELFDGAEVESVVGAFNGPSIASNPAYLFYEINQQSPAPGLDAIANDTAIQVSWDASEAEVRTQYLVSISNVTETPAVVSSPHYTYLPESQDCQWYEFLVTTHECFNATNQDTSQTTAASVRVAYPNISPVTAEFDNNQTVLVSWTPDGGSAFQIVVTDLGSGNQTVFNGTSPFSYIPAVCDQPISLNVSVSPAQCAGDPAFTHSATVSFTIPCPTTATTEPETETPDQPSGAQATLPSWLAVAAMVPLLRIARPAF